MAKLPSPPRVSKLEALSGCRLAFTLRGSSEWHEVELAGLVARTAELVCLQEPESFAAVRVVDAGRAVAWGEDGLKLSADTLLAVSRHQQPMSGEDLAAWRDRLDLTRYQAAKLLGVDATALRHAEELVEIDRPLAIACRAIEADPHLLGALFQPSEILHTQPLTARQVSIKERADTIWERINAMTPEERARRRKKRRR